MARTVADAGHAVGALTGVDRRRGDLPRARPVTDRVHQRPRSRGVEGSALGVCRSRFMGYSPATDALMETAIDALKRLGRWIVDPADIATRWPVRRVEYAVLLYRASRRT